MVYWLAVVLLSIVGTLITDNLVDNYGVALETTTIVFAPWPATSSRSDSNVGFGKTVLLFVAAIAVVAVAHFALKINAILGFWIAYILTRPLGASIGTTSPSQRPTRASGSARRGRPCCSLR